MYQALYECWENGSEQIIRPVFMYVSNRKTDNKHININSFSVCVASYRGNIQSCILHSKKDKA